MTENLIENIVVIKRTAKMRAGGRTFRMHVWVVVGDGEGKVGIGHGRAAETPEATAKALRQARKRLKSVVIKNGTLPHPVYVKFGAIKLLMKPAAPGTGIIASQPVRAILEAAGYKNVLTKVLGKSTNPVNLLKATMLALESLKDPEYVLKFRYSLNK
ncbi:MAG: 30S ribosomal protein S5 [candidate division WOR-3 bacterium]